MKELLFGTAGIPLSTERRNTPNGIRRISQLGLGAMELAFVQSVTVTEKMVPEVKETSQSENIVLTCHAPYFINLNSPEPPKLEASKQRILKSARRLDECGGWSVCFHPGFYLKSTKEEALSNVKKQILELSKTVKDEDLKVWLRPELTGKPTQFGTLEELLKISSETDNVMPCIDFAHNHARHNGAYNTYEEFCEMLEMVENYLGKKGLQNMHIHTAGINYGPKGEKNHLLLMESDMNFYDLVRAWRDFKISGVVVCESPDMESDALLLKKHYDDPSLKKPKQNPPKRGLEKFIK